MSNTDNRFRKTRMIGVFAAICMLALFPASAQEATKLADLVPNTTVGLAADSIMLAQARQLTRTTRKQTQDLEAIPLQARRPFEAAIGDLTRRQGRSAAIVPDGICDEWFVSWVDDGEGGYVPGSMELYCDGTTIPIA